MHKSSGKRLIIPVFIPHEGCPNTCVFCNQRSISGDVKSPTDDQIISTINMYLRVAYRYSIVELAFFGGSFTAIDPALQEKYLSIVAPYIGKGIDTIRLSTRPDCINDEVLLRLKKYNVQTIELGAQSMDDAVLKAAGRGHFAKDTEKASYKIKEYGFTLGLQTMPGLPLATRESDIETAIKIAALGPELVRIYPTITIKDTYLETMYKRGEYIPAPLDDMISLCTELMEIYTGKGIKVARIGLQSSENMTEDTQIVAGPYHPAFGQLVMSSVYFNKMKEEIKGRNISSKGITIYVPAAELSTYIGQKRKNIEELKRTFSFESVKISPEEGLSDRFEIAEN